MGIDQHDLFPAPRFDPLSALLGHDGEPVMVIVGCGRSKRDQPIAARHLYTSDRFQTACATAEILGAPYYILSGLHGLVRPDEVLLPYDLNLTVSDLKHRKAWSERIAAILSELQSTERICLLATAGYAEAFLEISASRGCRPLIVAPLASIDESLHGEWHKQALAAAKRYRALKQLYLLISKARDCGKTFLLGDLSKQTLPTRGVYVFLDPNEPNFNGASGRVVRIGTHAVSNGSKSTLRSRLRNHFGLGDGSGNHRGSIFRLHVGRALLEKDGAFDRLNSWGRGQDAPADVRAMERDHEIRVSNYLRALEVFILDIDDAPSKHSFRATVERQLIALCSEALQPIDRASEKWLGRHSPMEAIAQSGLWNLRDVGRKYEPESIGSVDEICSRGTN